MITKVIKLDINKNLYEKIKAKQGDTKSRFLLFQLLDGSMPFNLENRSVRAYMLKPDSTEVFNDLIINNRNTGHCTLELTNQVLAVAGIVKIELMIIENDKKITSSIFELQVDKSINSENSIVSTNEFNALLNGLASLSEYDNYKEKAKKVPELEENIQELGSQLEQKARESDLVTERKRIDNLAALEEGSTTGDAELIDGRVGANGVIYNVIGGNIRAIGESLTTIFSKNLLDKNKLVVGGLYGDGSFDSSNSNSRVTDFIEIKKGRTVYGSYDGESRTVDRYNVYGSNKELIKSVQYFKEYTAEQDGYIKLMLSSELIDKYQVEYDQITSFSEYHEPYYEKCATKSELKNIKSNLKYTIINVRKDGLGDYTELNNALESIKDNSEDNKYLIKIHEGTYNVCSFFTDDQINNAEYTDTGFVGLEVREGIYIEGIGVKEKIIIHGEIATTYSQNKREQISTLNLKGKCGLKNLTVTSKYIRYAVHDDFSHNENVEHDIENCDFINLIGSDEVEFSRGAYGLGTKSGTIISLDKCFIKPGMTYHTNTSFSKPSIVDMKDCYVDGEITLWDFNSTGLECYLNLYNTRYNNIRHAYNGSDKTQYIKINGVGNANSPIICDNSVIYKTDETIEIKNGSSFTIPIGKPVKRTGLKTIEPMYSSDDIKLFYGIALQEIKNGEIGLIQTKGYINSNFLNLNLNVGDKIGIINGSLAIVTENEIGKVEFNYNDIKLIKLN